MRDQFTILSLQQAHTQKQFKVLHEHVESTEHENVKVITDMKKQLTSSLQLIKKHESSWMNVEELVSKLNDNVHSMGQKISQEALNRDSAMQEVAFKIDRVSKQHQHETSKLADALNSRVKLLQDADVQLGQDVRELRKTIDSMRDFTNASFNDVVKQVADARTIATRSISDASSTWLKQAHEDAELQVNAVAETVAEFETRIAKSECLAIDTANRWLASNEQLKEQYLSVSQAIEECRFQNRTNHASTQQMTDQLGTHIEAVQQQGNAIRVEHGRERKAREEQFKILQQNLDGILKTGLADLEAKLFSRVDREAEARTKSIRHAVDEIGIVLETEMGKSTRTHAVLDAQVSPGAGEGTPATPYESPQASQPVVQYPASPMMGPRQIISACGAPRYNVAVPVTSAYPLTSNPLTATQPIPSAVVRHLTPPANPTTSSRHFVNRSASSRAMGNQVSSGMLKLS